TNQRLGRLPLVIGMKVMIIQNFDVPNGIVNGTTGILMQIRYEIDSFQRRHATSAIVKCDSVQGDSIADLPPTFIPIVQDSVSFTLMH
ncbi:hypothetical protein AGABI1DRAFT_16923, partial [Agaricus bisporus var. burnettii JB137-S8]